MFLASILKIVLPIVVISDPSFEMASFTDAAAQTWSLDNTCASNYSGVTQTKLRMWAYYQPSVRECADELWAVRESEKDPNPAIPIPDGWWLVMAGKASASGCLGKHFFDLKHLFVKKQLAFQIDTPSAKRFRNVFGYVAFIKPAESKGRSRPCAAKWRSSFPLNTGSTRGGEEFSHVYCRLSAFSSRCALPSSFQPSAMGSVVRGLIETADSDYDTAQLVAWSGASAKR